MTPKSQITATSSTRRLPLFDLRAAGLRALRLLMRWSEAHRARQKFQSLDDQRLKDMGLTRNDINGVTLRDFMNQPTRWDHSHEWRR